MRKEARKMNMGRRRSIFILIIYALAQLNATSGIEHRTVHVNGIRMHIAEEGHQGPVVLLLHGFPELWYTWRHQMVLLASNGYRAVAPDLRGYGNTESPPSVNNYTSLSVVGDLVALINVLGQDQVFVVGHDWGAIMAWQLSLFRPDKVKGLISLSVTFQPRNPLMKPTKSLRATFGEDYYIIQFQEPGKMEKEFSRLGAEAVLKTFLSYHCPAPFNISSRRGLAPACPIPGTLPLWLSKEDFNYYASTYKKKGFTGPLNYYRALDLNWELTAPWTGAQVKVPVKFIVGDQDLTYNSPGVKQYIHGGEFKKYVPLLKEIVVLKGVGHFINEEQADEVSMQILKFIKELSS